MIINLYGQPGAGKTTLAALLEEEIGGQVVTIDGDEWRQVTGNYSFTPEGRRQNLYTAYKMAVYLERRGFTVIVAMVSPYRALRRMLYDEAAKCLDFYLDPGDRLEGSERRGRWVKDYEYNPGLDSPDLALDTCHDTPAETVKKIMAVYDAKTAPKASL